MYQSIRTLINGIAFDNGGFGFSIGHVLIELITQCACIFALVLPFVLLLKVINIICK